MTITDFRAPLPPSEPGSLEFFLTERYCLYASNKAQTKLYQGRVAHAPWPLRAAQVLHRIRGALVIVGAPALVDSGLQIEQRIAQGDGLPAVSESLAAFQQRLQRLLEPLLDTGPSSFPDDPLLP